MVAVALVTINKMKKIAITGGKGGTGKSTFTIIFANKLIKKDKKVLLVDCDIECPNLYLLINKGLGKIQTKVYTQKPVIDKNKCQQCGLCVKNCRNNAIFISPKKYPIILEHLCSSCGACWLTCPNEAIKTKKEEIGKIHLNKISSKLTLITGVAKPALEDTSSIVKQLKDFSLDLAHKNKVDYIIYDTAAGTHCPVIIALLDNDLSYVVTEPTPLGAHDLNLILTLIEKIKIKKKIVLNQANLGKIDSTLKILKKHKIKKIDIKIPYSKKIVKHYSNGDMLNCLI